MHPWKKANRTEIEYEHLVWGGGVFSAAVFRHGFPNALSLITLQQNTGWKEMKELRVFGSGAPTMTHKHAVQRRKKEEGRKRLEDKESHLCERRRVKTCVTKCVFVSVSRPHVTFHTMLLGHSSFICPSPPTFPSLLFPVFSSQLQATPHKFLQLFLVGRKGQKRSALID